MEDFLLHTTESRVLDRPMTTVDWKIIITLVVALRAKLADTVLTSEEGIVSNVGCQSHADEEDSAGDVFGTPAWDSSSLPLLQSILEPVPRLTRVSHGDF